MQKLKNFFFGNEEIIDLLLSMIDEDINNRPDFNEIRNFVFYNFKCQDVDFLKNLTKYSYVTKSNTYLNFKLISNKENCKKSKLDECYEKN